MATITFNLHEGMAAWKLAQAIMIAPALQGPIDEYRAAGLTDAEIVQRIADVITRLSHGAVQAGGKAQ